MRALAGSGPVCVGFLARKTSPSTESIEARSAAYLSTEGFAFFAATTVFFGAPAALAGGLAVEGLRDLQAFTAPWRPPFSRQKHAIVFNGRHI